MARRVVAAVLAAGASQRFGSAKQLAVFNGQTLIEHIQTVLLSSSVDDVLVVLGCDLEKIKPHLLPQAKLLVNNDWEEGIASSVRCATQFAMDEQATHLCLFVCDQPYVSPCLVDKVVALSKFDPEQIIACRYGDAIGVPALFPRSKFDSLLSLKGDVGAKSVIKTADKLEIVDFPEGAKDVDCPTDLPLQI